MTENTKDNTFYKNHPVPQSLRAQEALNAHPFMGTETVLDIGCGDGRITQEIARLVEKGSVVGLDRSREMIRDAREYYGGINNLSFQHDDINVFETNKRFDLIVSFSTLHLIKNQEHLFEKMYRLLNPGGQLLIQTASGEHEIIEQLFNDTYWSNQFAFKKSVFHTKTAKEYQSILKNSAFTNYSAVILHTIASFSNAAVLRAWFMAWIPSATGLSKKRAKDFSDVLVTALYKKEQKQPNQEIDLITPLVHLEARR